MAQKNLIVGERSRKFAEQSARYWGRQYDHLPEYNTDDKQLKLREKRPAAVIRMTAAAVDTVNAYLFGEERGPTFVVDSLDADAFGIVEDDPEALAEASRLLAQTIRETRLAARMPELGRLGLLHGTVGLAGHQTESERQWSEVLRLAVAYPTFGADDRALAEVNDLEEDDLLKLDEYWLEEKTTPEGTIYVLHRRTMTTTQTIEYVSITVENPAELKLADLEWIEDGEKTTTHDLGLVPAVWIQSRPVTGSQDGAPLVTAAEWGIEDEFSYTLTQIGRAVRYNSEPTAVFTDAQNIEGVDGDGGRVCLRRGGSASIMLSSADDKNAKVELLEMNGAGQDAALAYLDALRRAWQDVTRVIEHDPARAAGVMSGVALERMMAPLVALVGSYRASYGPRLSRWLELMLRVRDADMRVSIKATWPRVIPLSPVDISALSVTVGQLYDQGLITLKTAVEMLAPFTGVADAEAYIGELAGQGTVTI